MNKYTVWVQMNNEWQVLVHYDEMMDGNHAMWTARDEFHDTFTKWFGSGNEDTVNLEYEEGFVGNPMFISSL